MTALHLPAYLLGRALGTILRPLLRRVDAYVTPALDIDWSDPLTEDDEVAQLAAELDDEERLTSWLRGPAT